MESSLSEDQLRNAVKMKLNAAKIKLWLPPYTGSQGEKDTHPEELITKYSDELNAPSDVIAAILEDLRQHALAKLAARKRFQEEGIANLKIKLTGSVPPAVSRTEFDLEIKLDVTSLGMRQKISAQTGIAADRLKLISCGQVLDDGRTLRDQGLGQHSQVMVICLSESELEARKRDEQRNLLERTKEAAKLLAQRNRDDGMVAGDDDKYVLQIADHTGKPIRLPDTEQQALSVAMTLNEKGRACLKRKQYSEALLILLEADQSFRQCRSEILQAVDNYAVLCLDIVWCYLCLQNVEQIPDAEARLKSCEDCFNRSYGHQLERLRALKGDSARELALYVRLYLLQGIVAVLKGSLSQGKALLEKAENILNSLQVDDTKLMQLVAMGYETSEARLGLRAADGNVSQAITKILDRRERRKEIAEKEKEERRQKKLQRKIGKTANGSWVNIELYEQMLSMGFSRPTVAAVLKQTNNDLHASLRVIDEHPELLSLPDDEPDPSWSGPITDEMIARVTEMGFDAGVAREALRRCSGAVEKAIERLVATGGILPATLPSPTGPSADASGSSTSAALTDEQKQAIEEVLPDIPDHEEDYLDITLDEEASFIAEYKARIESTSQH